MPKKLFAARDFNDAGTGRSFARGAEIVVKEGELTEGELANYEAAGLTTETDPQASQAAPVAANTAPTPQAPAGAGRTTSPTA